MASATAASAATSPAALSDLHSKLGNAAVQKMAVEPTTLVPTQTVAPAAIGQTAGAPTVTAQDSQRPRIDQFTATVMKEDVEAVVAAIRQQWVDDDDEAEALARVQKWASWDDAYRASTGYAGSDYLDKFLVLLKTRVYTHRTIGSAWVEQWTNAYDELWHELEDDRLESFKGLVARSKREGTAPGERLESAWSYVGKREAAGALGIVKAGGTTLGGLADVALWATGVKGPEGGVAGYLSHQFDELADIALPDEVRHEQLDFGLFKLSAYDFGAAAGKVPYGLALGGALGKAGALGQAVNIGQAAYSADQLGEYLAKLRKNLSWTQIAQRPDVWAQVVAVAAGAVGVRGGTASTEALRNTCNQLGIVLNLTQSTLLVSAYRAVDTDLTIPVEDKERKKAELLADAASGALSAVDARYGEKFKQGWDAHFTETIGPERQLAAGEPQIIGPERQLAAGEPQIIGPERQLAAGEPQIIGPERQLAAGEPQIIGPERQLAAGEPQIIGPERQLAAGEPQIIGPERQLAAGEPQIIGPERQLAAGEPQIIGPERQLAAGSRR